MSGFNIAIDGPAGAGKSSVSKGVASQLGFMYLDTGAMYRTMGLYMLMNGISLDDTRSIIDNMDKADIQLRFGENGQRMLLNGEDVSEKIRTREASDASSRVSVIPEVRARLVKMQQKLAANNDVVMDGRDICMYVLPNAQLKIYLTASVEVRAQRRLKEMIKKGVAASIDEIIKDVIERDERDMNRSASPLKKAPDAIEIDSSFMDEAEVVERIILLAKERMKNERE